MARGRRARGEGGPDDMETLRVRIIRFESAGQLEDESEGYFLAFAAVTPEVFSEAHRLVRSLPMWQRVWLPMAQVWWVHEDGLSYLARRAPTRLDARPPPRARRLRRALAALRRGRRRGADGLSGAGEEDPPGYG